MARLHLRQAPKLGKIVQADCRVFMKGVCGGFVDLLIADPPFNINEKYDLYVDKKPAAEYLKWSRQWMMEAYRLLKPTGTFWLSIGDLFSSELDVLAKEIGFYKRSECVWWFTFGVNSPKKFTPAHTHFFYYTKHKTERVFNGDEIKVPSMRQILYKDKRAKAGGRLPDDVWVLNPKFIPEGWSPQGDVWCDSRICGTFKERRGTPNQLPAAILERIVRLCSEPGQVVCDPFMGSGTTAIAAKKLGRQWFGCELSPEYVKQATAYLKKVHNGTTTG